MSGIPQALNVHNTSQMGDHYSRNEILDWVNEYLGCHYGKIEELCTVVTTIRPSQSSKPSNAGSAGSPGQQPNVAHHQSSNGGGGGGNQELDSLRQQLDALALENSDHTLTIEGLMRERDFYFQKLREVEVCCQKCSDLPEIKSILDILYATADGFAAVEGNDEAQEF